MPLNGGFFISKQDLETMLEFYHKDAEGKGLAFKGFLFRPGTKDNSTVIFPDPLYSSFPFGLPRADDDQHPNDDVPGCPFPPGYGPGVPATKP